MADSEVVESKSISSSALNARATGAGRPLVSGDLDIADNATPETVNVARLRVDSRKFAVARLAPKKYGDHISDDVQGGAAFSVQPAVLVTVGGAADTDVRAASEGADGVLLDANGDIVRER